MQISQFKSHMIGGGARPNHFRVTLNRGAVTYSSPEESFLIKAASLPASMIQDIPVMYRGREVHFAGERSFAPWTVQVINDTSFSIRQFFEVWHHDVQSYNATNGREQPAVYQTDLLVEQLGRDNSDSGAETVLYAYDFYNAYPVEVGEIQLSYDAGNQIEEFPVTFMYDWFKPSVIRDTPPGDEI